MTRGRKILIVDDEPNLRKLIAESLLMEGFEVAESSDGLEALKFLRSRTCQPGLILLDLMMPNMGGQDFRKEQLRDSQLSHIPVILLTAGRPSYEIIQEIAPQALVGKPFNLNIFLETVAKLCL